MTPLASTSVQVSAAGTYAAVEPIESRAMTLQDFLGLEGATLYGRSQAGVRVTEETALALTAAYACINVIATDLASLPLKLYRKRPGGGRDEVTDHPAARLMKWTWDNEAPAVRSRQALNGYMVGRGNGYAEITYEQGRPSALHLLGPTTRPMRAQDKRLYYQLPEGGTLPPYRVLHVAGLGPDGLCGYNPIRLFREAIGLGLATERFGASFFGQGTQSGGKLKLATKLNEEQRNQLRKDFEGLHQGPQNASRLMILQPGMDFIKDTVDPEDAQFLQTRQFQVIELCRIFRVPPHKVGDYSQSHLANIEAANIDYVVTTLRPWAIAVEAECNLKLLTQDERDAGFYFEHLFDALLRGDSKSRWETHQKALNTGVRSVNEVRELENANPIDTAKGGDTHLVQGAMVPLDKAGTMAAKVPPSPAPNPQDDEEETDGARDAHHRNGSLC